MLLFLVHKMVIPDTLHNSKNVALVAFSGVKPDMFNDANQLPVFFYVVKSGALNDQKIVLLQCFQARYKFTIDTDAELLFILFCF